MSLLNDDYTYEIDQLGYGKLAKTIRTHILKCDPPYAIGISGRWGSGKTSLMKHIYASLSGQPFTERLQHQTEMIVSQQDQKSSSDILLKYVKTDRAVESLENTIECIWFNPWEHEIHSEPMVELLKEIRRHFDYKLQFSDEAQKLNETTIRAGLDALGTLLKIGKIASDVQKHGEQYEHRHFTYTPRTQRFKVVFEKAVDQLLTRGSPGKLDKKARLAIFIDDLDRCEQDTIGKLLKEIKQYLATRRCVFAFGYDRHHIERCLSKTLMRPPRETRAYLEKLFQTTFYLKQPPKGKVTTFMTNLIKASCSFVVDKDIAALVEFLASIIDWNPRRLKAFVQTLHFHKKNSSFPSKGKLKLDDIQKLALITYLKLFFEPVYAVLEDQPGTLQNLINVMKDPRGQGFKNRNEYFFSIELFSQIHDPDLELTQEILDQFTAFNDEERTSFLNQVYSMQGRHSAFSHFRSEFSKHFTGIDSESFKQYL